MKQFFSLLNLAVYFIVSVLSTYPSTASASVNLRKIQFTDTSVKEYGTDWGPSATIGTHGLKKLEKEFLDCVSTYKLDPKDYFQKLVSHSTHKYTTGVNKNVDTTSDVYTYDRELQAVGTTCFATLVDKRGKSGGALRKNAVQYLPSMDAKCNSLTGEAKDKCKWSTDARLHMALDCGAKYSKLNKSSRKRETEMNSVLDQTSCQAAFTHNLLLAAESRIQGKDGDPNLDNASAFIDDMLDYKCPDEENLEECVKEVLGTFHNSLKASSAMSQKAFQDASEITFLTGLCAETMSVIEYADDKSYSDTHGGASRYLKSHTDPLCNGFPTKEYASKGDASTKYKYNWIQDFGSVEHPDIKKDDAPKDLGMMWIVDNKPAETWIKSAKDLTWQSSSTFTPFSANDAKKEKVAKPAPGAPPIPKSEAGKSAEITTSTKPPVKKTRKKPEYKYDSIGISGYGQGDAEACGPKHMEPGCDKLLEEHYTKTCSQSSAACKKLRSEIDAIKSTPPDERPIANACILFHKKILKQKKLPPCVDSRKKFKQLRETIEGENDKETLCPDNIAQYNCRAESGTKGDLYRLTKDDQAMESMCEAKVVKYISECNDPKNRLNVTYTPSANKICNDVEALHNLSKSKRSAFDKIVKEESAIKKPNCFLNYVVIKGLPSIPNFGSPEDARQVNAKGTEGEKMLAQDATDVLAYMTWKDMGKYSLKSRLKASLLSISTQNFNVAADDTLFLKTKTSLLNSVKGCFTDAERTQIDGELNKVREKSFEALVKGYGSASDNLTSIDASRKKAIQYEMEKDLLKQNILASRLYKFETCAQYNCKAHGKCPKSFTEKNDDDINNISAQYPYLSINPGTKNKLFEHLTKDFYDESCVETGKYEMKVDPATGEKVRRENDFFDDATDPMETEANLSHFRNARDKGFENQVAAFAKNCAIPKGANKEELASAMNKNLQVEGKGASTNQIVLDGYFGCADVGAKSDECKDRKSLGQNLCNWWGDKHVKEFKDAQERFRTALIILVASTVTFGVVGYLGMPALLARPLLAGGRAILALASSKVAVVGLASVGAYYGYDAVKDEIKDYEHTKNSWQKEWSPELQDSYSRFIQGQETFDAFAKNYEKWVGKGSLENVIGTIALEALFLGIDTFEVTAMVRKGLKGLKGLKVEKGLAQLKGNDSGVFTVLQKESLLAEIKSGKIVTGKGNILELKQDEIDEFYALASSMTTSGGNVGRGEELVAGHVRGKETHFDNYSTVDLSPGYTSALVSSAKRDHAILHTPGHDSVSSLVTKNGADVTIDTGKNKISGTVLVDDAGKPLVVDGKILISKPAGNDRVAITFVDPDSAKTIATSASLDKVAGQVTVRPPVNVKTTQVGHSTSAPPDMPVVPIRHQELSKQVGNENFLLSLDKRSQRVITVDVTAPIPNDFPAKDDVLKRIKMHKDERGILFSKHNSPVDLKQNEEMVIKDYSDHLRQNGVAHEVVLDGNKDDYRLFIRITPQKNGKKLNKMAAGMQKNLLGTDLIFDAKMLGQSGAGALYFPSQNQVSMSFDSLIRMDTTDPLLMHEIEHRVTAMKAIKGNPNDFHGGVKMASLDANGEIAVFPFERTNLGVYSTNMSFDELGRSMGDVRRELTYLRSIMGGTSIRAKRVGEAGAKYGEFIGGALFRADIAVKQAKLEAEVYSRTLKHLGSSNVDMVVEKIGSNLYQGTVRVPIGNGQFMEVNVPLIGSKGLSDSKNIDLFLKQIEHNVKAAKAELVKASHTKRVMEDMTDLNRELMAAELKKDTKRYNVIKEEMIAHVSSISSMVDHPRFPGQKGFVEWTEVSFTKEYKSRVADYKDSKRATFVDEFALTGKKEKIQSANFVNQVKSGQLSPGTVLEIKVKDKVERLTLIDGQNPGEGSFLITFTSSEGKEVKYFSQDLADEGTQFSVIPARGPPPQASAVDAVTVVTANPRAELSTVVTKRPKLDDAVTEVTPAPRISVVTPSKELSTAVAKKSKGGAVPPKQKLEIPSTVRRFDTKIKVTPVTGNDFVKLDEMQLNFPELKYHLPPKGTESKELINQTMGFSSDQKLKLIGSGGMKTTFDYPGDSTKVIKAYQPDKIKVDVEDLKGRFENVDFAKIGQDETDRLTDIYRKELIAKLVQREVAVYDYLISVEKIYLDAKKTPPFKVARINKDPKLLERGIIVQDKVEGYDLIKDYKKDSDAIQPKHISFFIDELKRHQKGISDAVGLQTELALRSDHHQSFYDNKIFVKDEVLGVDWGGDLGNAKMVKDPKTKELIPVLYDW